MRCCLKSSNVVKLTNHLLTGSWCGQGESQERHFQSLQKTCWKVAPWYVQVKSLREWQYSHKYRMPVHCSSERILQLFIFAIYIHFEFSRTPEEKELAEKKFMQVQYTWWNLKNRIGNFLSFQVATAYETLREDESRADYDYMLVSNSLINRTHTICKW